MSANNSNPTSVPRRIPAAAWLGLFAAVVLDVPVQLIWKALMLKYADPARGPMRLEHGIDFIHQARWFLHQTRSYGLLILFLCQFVNWIWVLGKVDLSFAQPFTALSYVAVATSASIYFGEHLGTGRLTGIAAILAGVILVGSSHSRSTPAVADATAPEPA